ncbi:MAG: methyltransferase domain-containing protein [Myxococcota bacterium]|nr:methyltransferase domain-containing protein [Myxococcota bacterium]
MIDLARLRPQPDDRLAFLQGFLRRPQQVGSVIPSSRFLERRLVQLASVSRARTVVELGPGTGGTTRAILRALPEQGRLLSIEIEERFAEKLARHPDPRLTVHRGSAADVAALLAEYDLPAPDAVISGIPFSTMPNRLGRSIVEAVREVLAPGGCFVAYQVRGRVGELGRAVFGRPAVQMELRNIPPMRLYRWHKL